MSFSLGRNYFGSDFSSYSDFSDNLKIITNIYRPFGKTSLKYVYDDKHISNYVILAELLKENGKQNYCSIDEAVKLFKANLSRFIDPSVPKQQLNDLCKKYFNCDQAKLIDNINEMLSRRVPISNFCKNNSCISSNYNLLEIKIKEDRNQTAYIIYKYFQDNLKLFNEIQPNSDQSSFVGNKKEASSSSISSDIGKQTSSNSNYGSSSNSSGYTSYEKSISKKDVRDAVKEEFEVYLPKLKEMFSNNQTISYQLDDIKKKLVAEEEKSTKLYLENESLKQKMTKVQEEKEELKTQIAKLQALLDQKENSQRLLDLGVVSNSKTDQVIDKAKRGLSEINDKITTTVLDIAFSNEMEDEQGIQFETFYKISLCHAFYCKYNTIDNILMTAYRKLKKLMDEAKINLKQGWETILPDFKSVVEAMNNVINQIPDNLNVKLDFSNDPKNKVVQEMSGQSSTSEYYCLFPSLSHGESLIEKGSILKVVKFQ